MYSQFARLCTDWRPMLPAAAAALWLIGTGPGLAHVMAAPGATTAGWRPDSLRLSDNWNTLNVFMTIKRTRVSKTGEVIGGALPGVQFRVKRSSASGQWRTILKIAAVDLPPKYSLAGTLIQQGSFPIARIEDDEDGSPVRMYDRDGKLLPSMAPAGGALTSPRTYGREWLNTFIATTALRTKRQQDIEREFVKAGKVGVLKRYLKTTPDTSQELLVDGPNMVPKESNEAEQGALTFHRTFDYAPAPDGVVRTLVHSESVVTPESGERSIVDTSFSDIRLEQRVQP